MPEQPVRHLQKLKISICQFHIKKQTNKRENLSYLRFSLSFFRQICRNAYFFERWRSLLFQK